MYLAHLVLTSAECRSPSRADAQRIQDGLWAHAPNDLGIEHIRARAGPQHIDVVLFFHSTIHGGIPDESAALAAIRNIPLLRAWHVILVDGSSV